MKKDIISTYHHSFAGGSKNTSRFLNYLSKNGCNVGAYFFEIPQYFTYTVNNILTHILDFKNIHSEVIDHSVITNYCVANQIVEDLKQKSDYTLFAVNLFPYCNIFHDVKTQINNLYGVNPKLIIHPVGSDIWQIGPQIKSRVKWLLDSPLVDSVLTYSNCFVNEIKEYYNIKKEIHILPPILEKEKFFPISKDEKSKRKGHLGFNDEDFIIHHHSSMRKIKCPDIVLDIVIKSAQLIPRKCILIMVGPVPHVEINEFNLNLINMNNNRYFKYKTICNNLTIYWTGIKTEVEYLLQISDVELNTSLHDSFNISLMEAMACGIPVVTSDIVGIRDHILLSNSGLCFPTIKLNFDDLNILLQSGKLKNIYFDIDYAISAILSIEQNSNSSALMGEAGAKYVFNEFSFENASKKFRKHIS